MGAVAQFERDLIVERVRAGMAHARAMGKRIGRPRAIVDVEAVSKLREGGRSLREIAVSLIFQFLVCGARSSAFNSNQFETIWKTLKLLSVC